jgi:PAS domain S-box-containing protein
MNQEIRALHELIRRLAAGASVADTLADQVFGVVSPEHLFVFLKDAEALRSSTSRHRSADSVSVEPRLNRLAEAISHRALGSGESLFLCELDDDSSIDLADARDLEIRSVASVPLLFHGEVLGTILLTDQKQRDFSVHRAYLEIASDCAALALSAAFSEEAAGGPAPKSIGDAGNPGDRSKMDRVSEALRLSEEKFRRITDNMCDLVCHTDMQGRYLYITPSYKSILGYAPPDLLGESMFERIHPEDLESALLEFRKGVETRMPGQAELRYRHADGHYVWLHATGNAIFNEYGEPVGTVVSSRDITERRKAEQARQESEEKYRTLVESIQDGVFLIQDFLIRFGNAPLAEMIGYSPQGLMGMDFRDLIAPEDLPMVEQQHLRRLLGESVPREYEFRMVHRDGASRVAVNVSVGMTLFQGKPAVIGTVKDITEKKRAELERRILEEQFRHVQKAESLAVLAGGIAHDFNNLLMGIQGNADLGLVSLPKDAQEVVYFQEIQKAVVRAAELCSQMLAYSGRAQFFIERIQLNSLIQELSPVIQKSISRKVDLRYQLAERLPPVEGDRSQLRQVILGLVINASEALGEGCGVVMISTAAVECTRARFRDFYLNVDIPEGLYVCVEVTDTGCGMDETIRQRVFEPFFSTKFTGRGLGLAAVLGIVRGHKGAIEVRTTPGQGSTFRVLLPAAAESVEDRSATTATPELPESRGRTILLVDDEEPVRTVAGQMMEVLGFKVRTARDGAEAVMILKEERDEIDLVVLDLAMPFMNGEEAYRAMKAMDPDLVILITSGYSEEEVIRRLAGVTMDGFIPKPFSFQNLREALSRAVEKVTTGRLIS